jgi:uncharacterized protein YneF (UPF0154 family)
MILNTMDFWYGILFLLFTILIGLMVGHDFYDRYLQWRKLPSLEQYLAANPECKSNML